MLAIGSGTGGVPCRAPAGASRVSCRSPPWEDPARLGPSPTDWWLGRGKVSQNWVTCLEIIDKIRVSVFGPIRVADPFWSGILGYIWCCGSWLYSVDDFFFQLCDDIIPNECNFEFYSLKKLYWMTHILMGCFTLPCHARGGWKLNESYIF